MVLEDKGDANEKKISKADKIFLTILSAFMLFIIIELLYVIYGLDIIGGINFWAGATARFFNNHAATLSTTDVILFFSIAAIFIFPSPLELFYYEFLSYHSIPEIYFATIIGVIIAQHINFFIGKFFSGLLKRVINQRKVAKYQRRIRRYGKYAIFATHMLPLPYSLFNVAVGMTDYDYKEWAKWAFPALMIDYALITLIFLIFSA